MSPCSACGLPFDCESWITLAKSTGALDQHTYLCPRCSLGRTDVGARESLLEEYRTRMHRGHTSAALEEDHAGFPVTADARSQYGNRQRRLRDLEKVLHFIDKQTPEILHVGCGQGEFTRDVAATVSCKVMGLEPVSLWNRQATDNGINTIAHPLEQWRLGDSPRCFDVIVEHHLLEHLHDPRTHLRCVAARLAPGGIALIEVPNLLESHQTLEGEFLRPFHENVFTPRGLATLCRKAGLEPFHALLGTDLRIVCRRSEVGETRQVFPGPDSQSVAQAAWSNDLRISLKRGLATKGTTTQMLTLAKRVHSGCSWPAGRADIAIEVAVAFEKTEQLSEACSWLRRSLRDRNDPEVRLLLRKIESVHRRRKVATATSMPAIAFEMGQRVIHPFHRAVN